MAWNDAVAAGALAITLLGLAFAPAASAQDPTDEVDRAKDAVDEEACRLLKDRADTTTGCAEALLCGFEGCIEAIIWQP